MFSSAGAQPISLKSFRGLGFPNKIARVYKHEHCLLPCVVLKSFCIEYSAKGAVKLAVSIAAGAGVLLLSMAVSWLFFRKAPWRQIGTVLVIVNAAPIGSNIAVYAQRLGLDSSYAVQMVCLSTLLSLITLPVMLSLAAALGFA
jgi:putative permease